ncbi:SseB family protein [Micromonospora zhanjiangensis]|uniref:SseB family protein n=1 Tax=Micromonospora zhanjiangensis TaxID=1522057 RepID=A0ABV8KM57_9ACTN
MDTQLTPTGGQPVPRWEPANDIERRLGLVLADQDFDEAMRILLEAPLVLPGFDDADRDRPTADGADADQAGQPRQRVLVKERNGVPYLLVFTSVEAMRRAVSAEGWRQTSMDELARAWPELGQPVPTGLAVNPGTPIVMLVEPEHVPLMNLPLPDPRREFEPANNTEAALREALVRIDGDLLLDVLVMSRVLVCNDGLEFDGVPTVVVFTSQQRCDAYLAESGLLMTTLPMEMVELLNRWPDPAYQLAVNPGAPIAFVLDGGRIPGMREYADELLRRRHGGVVGDQDDRDGQGDDRGDRVPAADDGGPPVGLPADGRIADLLRGSD